MRVITKNDARRIRYVAGLDAAFSSDGKDCLAAAVLWDLRAAAVCGQSLAVRRVRMPYIPGLLSFREAPALLAALRRLPRVPDLLLCDGQGVAHPRRFGVASHLGVVCDLPSVGCAKSRLTGTHREPGQLRGSWTRLDDAGEVIGSVLAPGGGDASGVCERRAPGIPGVRAGAVTGCLGQYRLPEPTRLADRLVARAKRESG